MDINCKLKQEASCNINAAALYVESSAANGVETVISVEPKCSKISEQQLNNLTYIMQKELKQDKIVIIKNMQMSKQNFTKLSAKIDCAQAKVVFLASIIN